MTDLAGNFVVTPWRGKKDHIQYRFIRYHGEVVFCSHTYCGLQIISQDTVTAYKDGKKLDLCKICERSFNADQR